MIFTYIPLVSIYNEQVGVATRKQYDVVLLGRKHPFVIFPRRLWLAASHVLISALLKINQLLVFRIALVSLLVRHKCHVHAVALWRIPSQRAIFTPTSSSTPKHRCSTSQHSNIPSITHHWWINGARIAQTSISINDVDRGVPGLGARKTSCLGW